MNTVKRIISLITVIFVVIRLFTINVSASFAAPIMAEETLKLLFIEALGSSGSYNMDDLEAWDYDDLKNEFEIQMNTNPNFKPKNAIPFLVSPDPSDIPGSPENVEKIQEGIINLRKQTDEVVANWFNDMIENGGNLYDFMNPTYTEPDIDLDGNGAVLKLYYRNQGTANAKIDRYRVVHCEYISVKDVGDGTKIFYCYNPTSQKSYFLDGTLNYEKYDFDVPYLTFRQSRVGDNFLISGDCRRSDDGSQIDTSTEEYILGEADGTQVTPDMLNPDGTVTIDGTTYYPQEFIDWDKFKDEAIIDLLNDILHSLENVPVIDNSKTDIGEIDSDVTLPSELSDFATPGLINVFPFCLPYDFIRGMRLFSAEPEVPHFETEIKIPAFLNVPAQTWKFEIDFKEFEPLAKITRWISLISFIYCLILLTPKIAKGA